LDLHAADDDAIAPLDADCFDENEALAGCNVLVRP
jgi:hypothetical protein